MSSKTFNAKNNNRAKKAISPVIATVILVAVAVVIAAALAGFSGSLFGSYSQGPQLKIQSMSLKNDGTGALSVSNSGSADDTVTKVDVKGIAATTAFTPNGIVQKNSNPVDITFDLAQAMTPGQQVTAVISFASGSTITQTVTVE
jgi:flagellin-like protein